MHCAARLYIVPCGKWQQGNIMPAANRRKFFDGSDVFLTYPQSPLLTRERIRDFFLALGGVKRFLIARELHDDGNQHFHAYIRWEGRRRFESSDCFDVDGRHPNIQRPRSAKDVVAYCSKDDDNLLANFKPEELADESQSGWRDILSNATGRDDFLARVRARYPQHYVLSLERLVAFCNGHYERNKTAYDGRGRSEFVEPSCLTTWVSESLQVRALRAGPTALGGGPSPLPSNPLKAYIG